VTETVGGVVTINVTGAVNVNSSDEITMIAPTINMKSDKHNKTTMLYDWVSGAGCGTYYTVVNSIAAFQTYSYGFVLNTNLVSVTLNDVAATVNIVSRTKDLIADRKAQIQRERLDLQVQNSLTSIIDNMARLASHDVFIQRADVEIHD
jgi:hypothetical protein